MDVEPKLVSSSVWTSPLPLSTRYRLWQLGGRRVHTGGWPTYQDITPELDPNRARILSHTIDVPGFWNYVDRVGYRQMGYWDGGKARAGTEKWLEHYISIELLQPKPGDVTIDVASCESPFPDILREHWGCEAYRQDLYYPPWVEDDMIGGDAAQMPLPDHFADAMTLHCSFEHFEGDRDSLFIREAERVLKPGGRLCILPLYTNRTYCIQTDLDAWAVEARTPSLEKDAVICIAEQWGDLHCRFYDSKHFTRRILANLGNLRLDIYRVENYLDVADDCYAKFAAVFTKP